MVLFLVFALLNVLFLDGMIIVGSIACILQLKDVVPRPADVLKVPLVVLHLGL